MDVETLSDDQIQRLLNHVDNMLISLDQMKAEGEQSFSSRYFHDDNGHDDSEHVL